MIKTDTRAETFAPNSFMQNHQKIIELISRTKETILRQTILYVDRNNETKDLTVYEFFMASILRCVSR